MTWDLKPEHEQEYFEFLVREFMPNIQGLGFDINEAWATAYGDAPQIQVSILMEDHESLQAVLSSPEWLDLNNKLLDHVTHYSQKIVPALSRFQF
jgi:hypothetical protein